MKVEIINCVQYGVHKQKLTQWVKSVCHELKDWPLDSKVLLDKKLTLAFMTEQEIQELNRKFRNKDLVTDILSFAPLEKDSMGELALCFPVIIHKAKNTPVEWLYYLILHGILHLLGFNHEKDSYEARKMYDIQDSVFQKLIGGFREHRNGNS